MPGTSGSGGRNARGTAAHVVAGTFRPDRHGGSQTPDLPKGHPEPPKPLDGDAAAEWGRMVAHLEQIGILSPTNAMALYQYCRMFAETEAQAARAEEYAAGIAMLEQNLSDVKGPDLVACFQEIGKLHALRAQNETKVRQGRMAIRQYLVEFGMTPAAVSRVKVPTSAPESKSDAFRKAKGA